MEPYEIERIRRAALISVAVNVVWFILETKPPRPSSIAATLDRILNGPANEFVEFLSPPGHGTEMAAGAFAAIVFSFCFYGVLAWIVLSLPAWWKNRP
jgi:hypothetical protein